MAGQSVAMSNIPPKVKLYMFCSPALDLTFRCLPRQGGLYEQDYVDIKYFELIEQRIREILARKNKK